MSPKMDEINLRTLSARFDSLIHPPPRGFGKTFSYISIALAAGLFLFVILVSTPWVSEWWGCAIASRIKSQFSRETAKQICDSAVLILQILLILSIGGVVFTESLSKNIGRFIDQFQSAALDALEKDDLIRRQAFIVSIEKIQELEASKNYKEFFSRSHTYNGQCLFGHPRPSQPICSIHCKGNSIQFSRTHVRLYRIPVTFFPGMRVVHEDCTRLPSDRLSVVELRTEPETARKTELAAGFVNSQGRLSAGKACAAYHRVARRG